jgi:hypothetical protein
VNQNLLIEAVELARGVSNHVTRDLIAGQQMRAAQHQQNLAALLDALQKRLIDAEGDGVADIALEVGLRAIAGQVDEIDQSSFDAQPKLWPLAEEAPSSMTIHNVLEPESASVSNKLFQSISSNVLRTADIGEKIAAIMRAAKTGQR